MGLQMSYSESELDFSFATNSVSDFDSVSESESEYSSEFMNLDIWFSLFYTYNLLNKLSDNFFYWFL